MFFHGPQFNTAAVGSQVWGGSAIDRVLPGRFGNIEITKVGYPPSEKEPKKGQTITYLERQAKLINTEENPREDMRYPVTQFFDCHKKFSEGLMVLITESSDCHNSYDSISDIISDYDLSIVYLPNDITDVFFDFTDLLEGLLLVSKRRPLEIITIRGTLEKMNKIYSEIYLLMLSCNRSNILPITNELSRLRDEIEEQCLLPTDEEYESELSETVATLNDEEKEELAYMFSLY
ncbi:Uncharacterised protein [uncultured archaeon]|nr:Uncharacterised protein [uncultured archaeon]